MRKAGNLLNPRFGFLRLLFCALFLAVSACQANNQPDSAASPSALPAASSPAAPSAAPATTAAQPPTPNAAQARTAIINALLALNTRPNRMESVTVLADGKTSSNVIEFIPPERKHIVSAQEGVEYIVAGGKVYMKTGADPWAETQIPPATFLGDGAVSAQSLGATVSAEQWLRSAELAGKPVQVYRYQSTTTTSGVELHSQTELWVGADGLPYQMIIDGDILSASSDPSSGENRLAAAAAHTTSTITFDDSLQIEAPVK